MYARISASVWVRVCGCTCAVEYVRMLCLYMYMCGVRSVSVCVCVNVCACMCMCAHMRCARVCLSVYIYTAANFVLTAGEMQAKPEPGSDLEGLGFRG